MRLARSTGQGYLLRFDAERGCKMKRYVGKHVEHVPVVTNPAAPFRLLHGTRT